MLKTLTTFCAGTPVIFPYLNDVMLNNALEFGIVPDVVHLANADGKLDLYLVHISDKHQKDEPIFVCICGGVAKSYRADTELRGLRHLIGEVHDEGGMPFRDFMDDFMDDFLSVLALEISLVFRACCFKPPRNFEIPATRVSADPSTDVVDRVIKLPEWYVRRRDIVETAFTVVTYACAVGHEPDDLTRGDLSGYAKPIQRSIRALLSEHGIGDAADATKKTPGPKKPKRSTRVRELLWNSYPHICGICGEQIDSFDEMHVDHIIPLSRGGKDILANLQLTHAKCNLEKGSAMPETDDEGEEIE